MYVTYRYRLYPTEEQKAQLWEIKDGTACAWNAVLAELMRLSSGKRITSRKLKFTNSKAYNCVSDKGRHARHDRMSKARAEARRDAGTALLTAWDSWAKIVHRDRARPRYKDPYSGPIVIGQLSGRVHGNTLKLWGMDLKFKKHRELPDAKSATISVDAHDRWWVGFSAPREITPRTNGKEIGIDVGVRDLLWTSEGHRKKAPSVNKRKARKRYKLEAKAAKLKKGGNKQRKLLARAANIQRDHVQRQSEVEWQLANELGDYHIVKMEDLKLKNMSARGRGKRRLNNGLRMVRLYSLKQKINQKCEERGNEQLDVKPAYTSQTCSNCDAIDKRSRKGPKFHCIHCDFELHADYNGAINVGRSEPKIKKKKKTTGGKISSMGKKRWSKTNTADKPADAQTGSEGDLIIKPRDDLGEMPEVGRDQVSTDHQR